MTGIEKLRDISENLTSAVILSAILQNKKKVSVPAKIFDDILNKIQLWPNDFLTSSTGEGHLAISYDKDLDEISFQLSRSEDDITISNLISYMCMRNRTEFGHVNHDSPLYKK